MCESDMAKAAEKNNGSLSPRAKRNNKTSPRSKRVEVEPSATVTIKTDVPADTNTARLQQFQKTKPCRFYPLGACSKNEQCPFAHEQQEMRPLPNLGRTKMCPTLIETKGCNRRNCSYAHTKAELRSTTAFLKSKICKFYDKSNIAYGQPCAMGDTCRFAHSEGELQRNQESCNSASGVEHDDSARRCASSSPASNYAYSHNPLLLRMAHPSTNAKPTSVVEYYSTYEEPDEVHQSEEREPSFMKQANQENQKKANMVGEQVPSVSINVVAAPDNYYVRSMALSQSTEQLREWSDARANQVPRINRSTHTSGLRNPFLSTQVGDYRTSIVTANSYEDEPLYIALDEREENGRLVERVSISVLSPQIGKVDDVANLSPRLSGLVMTNKNTFLDFSQEPEVGVNDLLLRSPRGTPNSQLPVFSSHL